MPWNSSKDKCRTDLVLCLGRQTGNLNEWPILSWSFYSSFTRKPLFNNAIFFRKHEETECKRWMISNDIRLHGIRWYWQEFKKPQTELNWEGKISGKGWARFSSSWECHYYTSAVSYNRKLVCAYFSRWLEYWWRLVPAFLSRRSST